MKITSKQLALVLLTGTLSFMPNACSKKKADSIRGAKATQVEAADDEGENRSSDGGGEDLNSTFGVMNFRQLAATYQTVTGITLDNAEVLAEYEKQLATLPKSFDPAAISAAKVSAATKLASSYCDAMSLNDALLTEKLGSNMATLGAMDSSALASQMLDAFYGPETSLQGDRAEDVKVVSELITELNLVQPETLAGAPAPASSVFMGACAAILSSAEFYIYQKVQSLLKIITIDSLSGLIEVL